jgi:HlyD family secretion protein
MPSMNMRAYIAGLIAFAIKHVSRRVGFAMAGVGATALAVVAIIVSAPANAPTNPKAARDLTIAPAASKRVNIAALGRLEPRGEVMSVSAPVQDRLQTLLVDRGSQVQKDQILGYLSTYEKQVADRAVIAAKLEEAKAQLQSETAYGEAAIAVARLQLRQVRELMPLRIAAQEANITNAEVELANNRDILESYVQLMDRQVSARRTYENQRALVRQGEERVKVARVQLDLLKQQLVIDEANAQAQIVSAESALQRAKTAIAIKSLEGSLASAAANIELTVIRAPIDGTILNVLARPGSPVNGTTILTMGDTSRMRAVAEVYETDIANIRVGQPAVVSSAALPRPLKGRVIKIGQMVFKNDVLNVDPAARSDARVVEVRIDLESEALAAGLSNLTVDVAIDIRSDQQSIPVSRNEMR